MYDYGINKYYMNFSDKFKKIYWLILLVILTGLCIWRLYISVFITFDIYLFILWFIIVLFPIISEVSIFGISLKKEIESVKSEVKSGFAEIKNSIQNHQSQVINFNPPTPASKNDIRKKLNEDVSDEVSIPNDIIKKEITDIPLALEKSETTEEKSLRVKERYDRIIRIEGLVKKYFEEKYNDKYKAQMKFTDSKMEKKIVVDGILLNEKSEICELIEIKTISTKSFENFFFLIMNFIKKLQKLNMDYPVRFVVVSEEMNRDHVSLLQRQVYQIGYAVKTGSKLPRVKLTCFKISDKGLEEITI